MASYTSTTTGAWSSAATWGGSGPPASGDTAVIAAGTAVTVAASATIGAGGTAATCLTVANNATLTVNSGVELTARGHVQLQDGAGGSSVNDRLVLAAGSTLTLDVPTGETYNLYLSDDYWQSGRLRSNGTSGSHCTIRKTGAGAAAILSSPAGTHGGCILATYTSFTDLGSATVDALSLYLPNAGGGVYRAELSDCTFAGGGRISHTNAIGSDVIFDFQRVRHLSPAGSNSLRAYFFGTPSSGVHHQLTDCVWLAAVSFDGAPGVDLSGSYFHVRPLLGASPTADLAGCFVRWDTADGSQSVSLAASLTDSYLFWDNASVTNPHYLQAGTTATGTVRLDGLCFEGTSTAGDGNLVVQTGDVSASFVVQRCLSLPNPGGDNAGVLLSINQATPASARWSALHNTLFAGSQGLGEVGHLQTVADSRYAAVKANLCWDAPPGSPRGYKLADIDLSHVVDLVDPTAADYNAGWQLRATSATSYTNQGRGYHCDWSVTPGAHDLDGSDPQFVDTTRNLASWDGSLGGPGTNAAALARLQADPGLTASSLLPWVRAGFRPQNAAYSGATYPGDPLTTDAAGNALGGTIGALAYQSATGGGPGGFPLIGPGGLVG